MNTLYSQLKTFSPANGQEASDLCRMQNFLLTGATPFCRANETAHFTASGWIVNPSRTKVLMVYHNI